MSAAFVSFHLLILLSNLTDSTEPDVSRRVHQHEPGPVQGFLLLQGSFSLPLLFAQQSGSGFLSAQRFVGTLAACLGSSLILLLALANWELFLKMQ